MDDSLSCPLHCTGIYCEDIVLTFQCRIVNSVERLLTELVQNENVTNLHVSTPNLAFAGERVSDSVPVRRNVHTYSVCMYMTMSTAFTL